MGLISKYYYYETKKETRGACHRQLIFRTSSFHFLVIIYTHGVMGKLFFLAQCLHRPSLFVLVRLMDLGRSDFVMANLFGGGGEGGILGSNAGDGDGSEAEVSNGDTLDIELEEDGAGRVAELSVGGGVADAEVDRGTGDTSGDGSNGDGAGGGDRDDQVLGGVNVTDIDNGDERGVLDNVNDGRRGVGDANLDAGGVGVEGRDGGETELGERNQVSRDPEERATLGEGEAGAVADVGGDQATESQVKLLLTEGSESAVVGETEVTELGALRDGREVGNVSVLGAGVVGSGIVDVDGVKVDSDEGGGDGLNTAADDDVGGDGGAVGILQGQVDVDVAERGAGKSASAHGKGTNVGKSAVAAGEAESGATAGWEADGNGARECRDGRRGSAGSIDGNGGGRLGRNCTTVAGNLDDVRRDGDETSGIGDVELGTSLGVGRSLTRDDRVEGLVTIEKFAGNREAETANNGALVDRRSLVLGSSQGRETGKEESSDGSHLEVWSRV